MFPYQALKKHAPFVVGGTYTVTASVNGQEKPVAVIRSTLGASGNMGIEQWAFAVGSSASLQFQNQEYGANPIAVAKFPEHLPWPDAQIGASVGDLKIYPKTTQSSADLATNLVGGGTIKASVRTISSTANVQNPAPATPPTPTGNSGTLSRRTEVLKSGTTVVGHVYAEWSSTSATSNVMIWQLVKASSFVPNGICSFGPGAPPNLAGALSLPTWYAAAVAQLNVPHTSLTLIHGTATRKPMLP